MTWRHRTLALVGAAWLVGAAVLHHQPTEAAIAAALCVVILAARA
jgi:hypothetical protein